MVNSLKQDISDVLSYVDATEAIDPTKARAALARRIDNEDQFAELRVSVMARFVLITMRKRDKNYAEARALLCVNKGLAGVDAKVPDDKKRTQAEEIAWTTARSNFRHLLGRLGVKSKDAREGNQNAKRTPNPAPKAEDDAPIKLSAVSVPKTNTAADLDTAFAMLAAWTSRLQAANANAFVGDKGSAYLALVAHIQAEVKRAAAITDTVDEAPKA